MGKFGGGECEDFGTAPAGLDRQQEHAVEEP